MSHYAGILRKRCSTGQLRAAGIYCRRQSLLAKAVQMDEWRRERPDWGSYQAVDGSHVYAALILVILRQDNRTRNSGTNEVIQSIFAVMVTNSMEQHPSSPAVTVSAVCVHLD